ncbi:hypothetical protein MUP38_02715 [Candidatus Bathyarchaeota archaeon]|nr:hypothetical protein [Candidatus Bathyarchaeota archaeon]
MGHEAKYVKGKVPNLSISHLLDEALIDGKVYVADFNLITPREGITPGETYYEQIGFIPDSGYDPDWYKK